MNAGSALKSFLFATGILFYTTGVAQKPTIVLNDMEGWHRIASVKMNLSEDSTVITVAGARAFADLKFKLEKGKPELFYCIVYFKEGDRQTIKLRKLSDGTEKESQPVKLRGDTERTIVRIVLHHRHPPEGEKKGEVDIWGRKTDHESKK